MRELYTEIQISATPERVWSILTDFDNYPQWNPFIKSINGEFQEGGQLEVVIQPPGGKSMTFKPICLKFIANKELRWLGKLGFKGIFDGEHIFEVKEENGKTSLIQREYFKGILVPLFWSQLKSNTKEGFELMNKKIKELAESTV